jgi:hypothetical protein
MVLYKQNTSTAIRTLCTSCSKLKKRYDRRVLILMYYFIVNVRLVVKDMITKRKLDGMESLKANRIGLCINLLKTKQNLLHIRNQFVPRCKHFSSWLKTKQLMTYKTKSLFVLRSIQNTQSKASTM